MQRQVSTYIDRRKDIPARYQLICAATRGVMVLGSLRSDTKPTALPRAPKGWGWRTALLFDELAEVTPSGSLRVSAIIHLT